MVYSYSLIDNLVCPGGTISMNDDAGDTWFVDPEKSSGLAMRKVRDSTYDYSQQSGYYFGNFYLEGRHLLLAGILHIRTVGTEAAILSVRESMIAVGVSALTSISEGGGNGTLNFVGGSSLTVKCDLALNPTGPFLKNYVFGLVSAS